MRLQVEIILTDAEEQGKVFIEGKPAGLIREYDLILSDNKQTAAIEMLTWKETIREEMIHFKYKEIK